LFLRKWANLNIPLTQVMYKGKPVIVEGGAIDTNGRGTLLTSEELDAS
jgi:agmatine deiminase